MARAKSYPPEVRDLAKSLYLAGQQPQIISKQVNAPAGAIRGWVRRLGWARARTKAFAGLDKSPRSFAERSEAIRETLGGALERHAEQFAAIRTANGHAALKLNEKAEPLIRNASKVFGWEPGVHVQSIVSLSTVEPTQEIITPAEPKS